MGDKKDDNLPAPAAPTLPMLPELIANAMPVPMPQLDWDAGIIDGFFHNWKMKQRAKASEHEARLAENKNRMVKANLDMMTSLMTYSAGVQMIFKRFEHEKKQMEMEEYMAVLRGHDLQADIRLKEQDIKLKGQDIKLQQVKIEIAEAERDKSLMENEVVKMNLKRMLNDSET